MPEYFLNTIYCFMLNVDANGDMIAMPEECTLGFEGFGSKMYAGPCTGVDGNPSPRTPNPEDVCRQIRLRRHPQVRCMPQKTAVRVLCQSPAQRGAVHACGRSVATIRPRVRGPARAAAAICGASGCRMQAAGSCGAAGSLPCIHPFPPPPPPYPFGYPSISLSIRLSNHSSIQSFLHPSIRSFPHHPPPAVADAQVAGAGADKRPTRTGAHGSQLYDYRGPARAAQLVPDGIKDAGRGCQA